MPLLLLLFNLFLRRPEMSHVKKGPEPAVQLHGTQRHLVVLTGTVRCPGHLLATGRVRIACTKIMCRQTLLLGPEHPRRGQKALGGESAGRQRSASLRAVKAAYKASLVTETGGWCRRYPRTKASGSPKHKWETLSGNQISTPLPLGARLRRGSRGQLCLFLCTLQA